MSHQPWRSNPDLVTEVVLVQCCTVRLEPIQTRGNKKNGLDWYELKVTWYEYNRGMTIFKITKWYKVWVRLSDFASTYEEPCFQKLVLLSAGYATNVYFEFLWKMKIRWSKNGSNVKIAELELKLSAKIEKGMMMGHERSMRPF